LIEPWQNPNEEEFWRAKGEDQHITVKLSQRATEAIWEAYRLWGTGYIILTFDGELRGSDLPVALVADAVRLCQQERLLAYSLHRRRAWRIVWHYPAEKRSRSNFTFERVELMGFKGISDQWKGRPRARLFDNDF
jgi:hypothetical protein